MVLVLDGGLGTALEEAGHKLNDDGLWSARLLLDDEEALVAAHRAFYEAGADVVTTAGYQFSFAAFEERGLSKEEASALLGKGVELARRARDEVLASGGPDSVGRQLLVAASFGSYGAVLSDGSEFTGVFGAGIGVPELQAFHEERLRVLLQCPGEPPDFLAFETLPSVAEVKSGVRSSVCFASWTLQ